jgi:hypothetical protein
MSPFSFSTRTNVDEFFWHNIIHTFHAGYIKKIKSGAHGSQFLLNNYGFLSHAMNPSCSRGEAMFLALCMVVLKQL